ncbi:uncharacterized protein LOC117168990 isoform X2 [Belonocnema kinseyi]|uniref:uncharacterized protein LOC117168990 isoform X2 n=1 Tax=Belonocnema kinseyi TaxID=2817044 RepID=UPI00143D1307|nr:uncharacterized protein LOC117168990 isoform X2 [Belonocnema kinseyi]
MQEPISVGISKAYRSNDVLAPKGGRSTRRLVPRVQIQTNERYRVGSSTVSISTNSEIETRVRPLKRTSIFAKPFTCFCGVVHFYLRLFRRCATCVMGIMSVFKWLRKDGNVERHPWSMPPDLCRLNNETCRIKAIRAFMDRRKSGTDPGCLLMTSPDKEFHFKTYVKKNNENNKVNDDNNFIPGVPHIPPSELFEIGWVAGTEDRYLEYIYAEWDNTKVSVKKHTHPDCENAIKADLAVLTEIRHPNIILLIATSQIKDHGIISIFEFLNCTLYSYIHEKGERISVQEVSRCARKLAEALGFAHMRGFIHGAISSHCVFLASGVIKLGGWELATQKDEPKSKQDFQARLRAEIFRWQAPEIFRGRAPTEATDVYGLSLLIWEMTTMHLPWSGLSKPEVERQYVHWERGVMIDLYNFPQLLGKLLEAGLQIDATKRTMSMNRMRRFLQRLELQYETEAPIYANQYTNNNNINQNSKVCNVPICISPTTKCPTTPLSAENSKPAPKTLFNSQKKVCNRLMRSSSKKELVHKDLTRLKLTDKQDSNNLPAEKKANLFLQERLHNEVHDSVDTGQKEYRDTTFSSPELRNDEAEVEKMSVENEADEEILSTAAEMLSTADEILSTAEEIHSTTEERVSSNYGSESTRTLESSSSSCSDDDITETRNDIQKLRETLATKRERFFYGNDLRQASNADTNVDTEEKNAILERVRSKDYEPHKPASHKTCLEPKMNKSLQYETMLIKPASHREQKTANLSFPSEIKEAVLNPQLFNANCQDVFESSMWRREKMICLSKMRKSDPQNIINPQNSLPRPETLKPVVKNETFIIKELDEPETEGNSTLRSETCSQDNEEDSQNKSLVALKQALDRATDIIRPSSPVSDESRHSSPLRTLDDNLEITPDDRLEIREALFENAFGAKIGSVDPDSKIRSIERIIPEEQQLSQNTYKIKKAKCLSLSEPKSQLSLGEVSVNEAEERENDNNNMTLMLFSDKNHEKGCNSCHHMSALARRRSLPAALGQLKAYSRLSIGRLPIRRGDHPDSTVEDLYIDDEFGDSLNVNMVLLEDDDIALDEDDIMPDLLELSHHSPHNL